MLYGILLHSLDIAHACLLDQSLGLVPSMWPCLVMCGSLCTRIRMVPEQRLINSYRKICHVRKIWVLELELEVSLNATFIFFSIFQNMIGHPSKVRTSTDWKERQRNKSLFIHLFILFIYLLFFWSVVRGGKGDEATKWQDSIIQLWSSIIQFIKHHLFWIMQLYMNYGAPYTILYRAPWNRETHRNSGELQN